MVVIDLCPGFFLLRVVHPVNPDDPIGCTGQQQRFRAQIDIIAADSLPSRAQSGVLSLSPGRKVDKEGNQADA